MENQKERGPDRRSTSWSDDGGKSSNPSSDEQVSNSDEHVFDNHMEEIPSQTEDIVVEEALPPLGPQNQLATEENIHEIATSVEHANVNEIEDVERREPNTGQQYSLDQLFRSIEDMDRRSRAIIEEMPRGFEYTDRAITISEHHVNNPNSISSSCPICHDNFKLGEEASQLECGHVYHRSCISTWLAFGDTCPVCRSEMST